MALSTLAAVKAGLRPSVAHMKTATILNWTNWSTPLLTAGGVPDALTAPTPGVAGQTMVGPNAAFIPCPNAASGETKLARAVFRNTSSSGLVGGYLLADLLWINSGLSVTSITAQTVNSVAWPARDFAGSTNGDGVEVAVLVTGALGAGTPTFTLGYTNEAGTAGKSAVNINPMVSVAPVGMVVPFGLAAGDTGVRSIQNHTNSATMTSGSIALIAYRPLLYVPAAALQNNADSEVMDDILTLSSAAIKDGHCLFVIARHNGNATPNFTGNFTFAQG